MIELQEGDIVYIGYGHEIPVGFYEVTFTNGDVRTDVMWFRNDRDGCYNTYLNEYGIAKLIARGKHRFDKLEHKINVYADALKYYRDEMHYDIVQENGVYKEEIVDRGEVARNALELE